MVQRPTVKLCFHGNDRTLSCDLIISDTKRRLLHEAEPKLVKYPFWQFTTKTQVHQNLKRFHVSGRFYHLVLHFYTKIHFRYVGEVVYITQSHTSKRGRQQTFWSIEQMYFKSCWSADDTDVNSREGIVKIPPEQVNWLNWFKQNFIFTNRQSLLFFNFFADVNIFMKDQEVKKPE